MECIINKETIIKLNALLSKGHKIQLEYDKKRKQVRILDLRLTKIDMD